LIWLQVLLMKTVGVNEIAIRLPSAMAAFITCFALLLFSLRYLKNFWIGFIAVILLITSEGYVTTHMARTGDYDALLTLFTTLSCLSFYAFCETKKNKFLYLFFASLTLAVLTKGIAGLLFSPAFILYVIFQRQLKFFLKNKHFYIGLFTFLFIALGYYLLREANDPGYISIIRENELGGRFLVSQGNQAFDFWFYYNNFITYRLPDRYLLIPLGLIAGLLNKDARIRKFTFFISLAVVTFFVVISTAKTKLEWYDAPLYPFLSILIAFFIHYVFDLLKNTKRISRAFIRNLLAFGFLFFVFIIPYQKVWTKTHMPKESPWDMDFYEIGYYLKDAVDGKYDLNGKYFVNNGYNLQNLFYTNILQDKGIKTGFKDWWNLKKDDVIIVYENNTKQFIKEKFCYEEAKIKGNLVTYTITGL
jgi:4-amino-4-deoxy-L-arabinose transferase-like glycosyltransferase